MRTVILSTTDTQKIVQQVGLHTLMEEMIDRLETTFREYNDAELITPPRDGFSYQEPVIGLLEWMPVMRRGHSAAIKVVGYHPDNPAKNTLPTIVSTVSLYDTHTGHLIGLIDGTFLTALRTGAASAVASKVLASPESRTVGLIGAGAQAITQLHAISRVFEIDRVFVYDINTEVCGSFRRRARFMNLEIIPVDRSGLDMLVRTADILCTQTTVPIGEGPVFDDVGLLPGVHINAVGSDFPGKVEIPESQLRRSLVCPDFLPQAVKEGECQRLDPGAIGPTIVEIVKEPDRFAAYRSRPTVFDSTGWAQEDQVAAELLIGYAEELGLGVAVEIENIPDDPIDPYQLFHSTPSDSNGLPGG